MLWGLQRAELQGFSQVSQGFLELTPLPFYMLSPCCSSGSLVPVALAQLGMLGSE